MSAPIPPVSVASFAGPRPVAAGFSLPATGSAPPTAAPLRPAPSPTAGVAPAVRAPTQLRDPVAMLDRIEGARARLDTILAEARRGRNFTPAELLCLQADAHRFAQTVEIAARGVEHGVQSLRQALHAQV